MDNINKLLKESRPIEEIDLTALSKSTLTASLLDDIEDFREDFRGILIAIGVGSDLALEAAKTTAKAAHSKADRLIVGLGGVSVAHNPEVTYRTTNNKET